MKSCLKIFILFLTCFQASNSFARDIYLYKTNQLAASACASVASSLSKDDFPGAYCDSKLGGRRHILFYYFSAQKKIHSIHQQVFECPQDLDFNDAGKCVDKKFKPDCPKDEPVIRWILESEFDEIKKRSLIYKTDSTGKRILLTKPFLTNGGLKYEHCQVNLYHKAAVHTCYETTLSDGNKRNVCRFEAVFTGEKFVPSEDNSPLPDKKPLKPEDQKIPDQNRTCGIFNGNDLCIHVDKNQPPNCRYSNGQDVCIDPKTNLPIDPKSPDHPKSGGNADGDKHNDPKDPNQDDSSTQGQSSNESATNKTVSDGFKQLNIDNKQGFKDVVDANKKTNESITELKDYLTITQDDVDSSTSSFESLFDKSLDEYKETFKTFVSEKNSDLNPTADTKPNNWKNVLNSIFPSASNCFVKKYEFLSVTASYTYSLELDFCTITRLRSLLEWVLSVAVFFYCLNAVYGFLSFHSRRM